ncbi:MAG: extracellular solute-binding protein [Candidatus Competibacteraceae bacterium]|nr:extracellular solute-binding protein [Candidatus Competibacteraceae bacterium]
MNKRLAILFVLLALLLPLAFAGGGKETAAADKPYEHRFLVPTDAGSVQWTLFNERGKEFTKTHPGVTVVIDAQPSAQLRTKLTVEMAAGNPPQSSWCILSYSREFMKDNKIMDWRPVYEDPKHPQFKQWYTKEVLEGSKYKDGRLMSVPNEASMDALYYNKELFDKNGWQLPKTFDDLLSLAKAARSKGIYLMVTGGKDIRFAWQASAILMRTTSVDKANELTMGSALNKWNDPVYGFPQAMEKFAQLVKAEAYPPGVLGFSVNEADQFFARGEAAMYFEGAWKPTNFLSVGGADFIKKVHRIDFPMMSDMPEATPGTAVGGTIVGYIVAANQTKKQLEDSVDWLTLMVDPQLWKDIITKSGAMPFLPAGKIGAFDWSPFAAVQKELYDAFQSAKHFVPSMDAWAPPPVDLAIKKTAMPGIISGEFTAQQAVAEVQKAAEDYLKTAK